MNDESNYKYIIGVTLVIIIALAGNWRAYKSGRVCNFFDNLATPHSGENEVLPEKVMFIIEFARMNQVKSISLSRTIADNRFIAQPLTEGAYPIIIKESADIFVSYSSELMPIGCATLKTGKGIRIACCL